MSYAMPHTRSRQTLLRMLALAPVLLLSACASFLPDGGMESVKAATGPELAANVVALRSEADAAEAQTRVKGLLGKPLSADSAVRVALLNNRNLQASYNELGIAEAVYVQAGLPPVPRVSLSGISGGGAFEFEAQIAGSILSLATLPARTNIAADRFRQAQGQAALETVRVATEARRSFIRAVAARELEGFLTQAVSAAQSATALSKRLGESGSMTKLDQARDQVFYAEITAQLATARQRVIAERERLVRALGLWGGDLAFKIPSALPPLPKHARVLASVESEAVRRRIDLQSARIEVEALAKAYGLKDAVRFINLVDASGISKTAREPGGSRYTERGASVEFEVPIYDFGEAKMREAEESYLGAVNRLVAKAVNVRSEAREAYQAYRASFDIARHYRDEVLPLRKIISDETLLRYNAMQIDVFSLLTEARQRLSSIAAAIDAEQSFWLADAQLSAAMLGADSAGGDAPPAMATQSDASGGQH